MTASPNRLQRRVMSAITVTVVVLAITSGLLTAVAAYTVEDRLIAAELEREARVLEAQRAERGVWPTPSRGHMDVRTRFADFPSDLQRVLLEDVERDDVSPIRAEAAGDSGRHYHIRPLRTAAGDSAWLLAEVSADLVVRPMRGALVRALLVNTLIVLVFGIFLARRVASRTAGPLAALADRVQHMRPDGLTDEPAITDPNDEVGVLAQGIAQLSRRVHTFVARERTFTRDVSHELRTPLAVIRSTSERLAQCADLPEVQRVPVARILESARALEDTVTALLCLARDEPDAEPGPTALVPLLESVILDRAGQGDTTGDALSVVIAGAPLVPMPPVALRIVLNNLLANAAAHGIAGSPIAVTVSASALSLENRADPTALPENPLAPFARGPQSMGHGLGLEIVSRLAARYGLACQRCWSQGTGLLSHFPGPMPPCPGKGHVQCDRFAF
jgi:signal transduction histidine kinase